MDRQHVITDAISELSADFVALSDMLWDNPELRWNEHHAVRAQTALAEARGFRVRHRVADLPTAFFAEAGSGGPVIAVLGEFDALAGLSQESGVAVHRPEPGSDSRNGQGCGHHLLGTGSLLAAVAVKLYLEKAGHPGRIRYYGCPAEEAAAGKTFMVKSGAFDDVDIAISWHPASTTGVIQLHSLAYCQVYFRFAGIAAHAGASPHLGRSALDAVELMNVGTNFLREHMPLDCRVHYAITDAGGDSPNVVQAGAEVYYIVRAPNVPAMRELYERVCRIASGAALMTDTVLTVEFDGGCSELLGNDTLDSVMHRNLAAVGPVPFDEADRSAAMPYLATIAESEISAARRLAGLPTDDVAPLHEAITPLMTEQPRPTMGGSTDVGDVSWVVPTVQCTSAVAAIGTPAHSWQLVAQGKLPAAHKGMVHAATVMATTAAELFGDPDLLSRAKDEFDGLIARRPYDCPIPAEILAPPLRATT